MGDVSISANMPLGEMFTTVFLGYDVESQRFRMPENILNPPQISDWNPDGQPTISKPWRDYTFPGIGISARYPKLTSEGKQSETAESDGSRLLETRIMEMSEQVDTLVSEQADALVTEQIETQPTMSDDPENVVSQAQPSVVTPSSPIECQAPMPMGAGEQTRRYKWRTVYSCPSPEKPVLAGSQNITVENPEPEAPGLDRSRFGNFDPYRYGHPGSSTLIDCGNGSLDVSRVFEQRPGEVSLSHSSTDLLRGAVIATSWDQWKDVQQNPRRRPAELLSGVSAAFPQSTSQPSPSSVDFPKGAAIGSPWSLWEKTPRASKYSPKRGSRLGYRGCGRGSRNTSQAHVRGRSDPVHYGHKDLDKLIDVSSPDMTSPTHIHSPLTFNQAPLVPDTPTSRPSILGESRRPLFSSGGQTATELAPRNENEQRFVLLRKTCEEDLEEEMPDEDIFTSAPVRLRSQTNTLVEQWVENQTLLRPETESAELQSPRKYHRTMQQRMGKPSNSKTKAEKEAKRRATLDDAWGAPNILSQSITNESVKGQKKDKGQEDNRPAPSGLLAFTTQEPKASENASMDQTTLAFFEALKPSLEFAEYFQGAVHLEIQIGLILIPHLPRTFKGGIITLDEWAKIFKPQTGVRVPGTAFINAVTTSAIDIDYILDLHTSKHDGSMVRLFEEEYTDYRVVYEIRCRTKTDQIITIVIDETGNFSIKLPATQVGKVNIHFPGSIWDACAVVSGVNQFVPGSDPELDAAIKHFIDSFYVEPGRTLVCCWASIPEGKMFEIEKVFMKRWTRHRYIRPEPDTIFDDGQDLFLQVTEVQSLATGLSSSNDTTVRARALPAQTMIDEDRQWYEVSLVSPAIETVLSSNTSLEVGERTREWRAADLFGKDAIFLPSANPDSSSSISPVASAIGNAGLNEMLTLTRYVVENMDGVGHTDYGPYASALPEPDQVLALPAPPPHSDTMAVPCRALPPSPKVEVASKDVQTSNTGCAEKNTTGASSSPHTPVKTAPLTSPVYATAPMRMRALYHLSGSDPTSVTAFERVPVSQTVPTPGFTAAGPMPPHGLAESSSMPDESWDTMSSLASDFGALTISRPAPEPAPTPAQEPALSSVSTPVNSPRKAPVSSAPTPRNKRAVADTESTPTRSPSAEQSQSRELVTTREQDTSSVQGVQTSRSPTKGTFYEKYILGSGGFW